MRKYFFLPCSAIIFSSSCHHNSSSESKSPEVNKDTLQVEIDTTPLPELQFAEEPAQLSGIKFKVDDVVKNKTPLESFSAEKVLANFVGKNITFCPDSSSTKLVPLSGNGLIQTIYLCYAKHYPLVLSPDAIWMTIAQGVSTHINVEFKTLKSKLFTNEKPKVIEVRNDSLDFGAKYWQQLIGSLSDSTRKYTQKDMYDFLVPTFSTTTSTIHTAFESNLLYAFKEAFTYVGMSGCGIPYITLTGTKQDWIEIKERLIQLDKIGLGYWRKELEPVMDEFIAVYENKRNELFWKNIIKEYSDYGEFAISGWIIKFFPYKEVYRNGVEDPESGNYRLERVYEKNEFLEGDKYLYCNLSTGSFPTYKSEAKIIYKNYFRNETTNMYLYSGIMAAKQYEDGSLKPWVTWGISSEKEPNAKEIYLKHQEMVHQDPDWTPYVYRVDSLMNVKPIYPKRKGITYEESVQEFKKELKSFLGKNTKHNNDTLTFYILANGKPMFITKDKKKELKIQNWIDQNGIKWIPAEKKLEDIMMMDEPKDKDALIKVNSRFEMILNEK